MEATSRRSLFVFLMLLAFALVLAGCSNNGSAHRMGNEASTELFDHSYGYLFRADPDFVRLAPNYSTLRPFNVDTAIVCESKSEREGLKNPPADYQECMYIRLNRPMNLRVIVADSIGLGVIVYDFANMPNGSYSLGSKGWPVPQIDKTKDLGWVYVYVIADQRLRDRRRFKLDDKQHFIPMPPEAQPS
jgi:hypothetical protein